ncbi:MAG: hypothetical protein ACOX7J_06510 [Bacillota bacterium]|jgi:hypothetical protein
MNKAEIMMKTIKNFKFDKEQARYDLGCNEMLGLLYGSEDVYQNVYNSFCYGFIKGMRYMKAHQRKAGGING